MVGWHHQLNGNEFEWTPGVGDGQGSLVCCSPWGSEELHMTERLNWTDKDYKEIQPVHSKGNQSWIFTEGLMLKMKLQYFRLMQRTDSLKRPWCWERLKAGGEGDDRRWDGWMASPTQWTWVWVSSGSWWWTGKPGVLQSMGSQRAGHDWVTEQNWLIKGIFVVIISSISWLWC